MERPIQNILMILLLWGIAACAPVTPATQEAAPPSQPASAEGLHPLSTRTGLAEIDKILDVLARDDDEELRSLIQFTDAECTQAEGLGGPPKCRAGEAQGTPVEVLPFLGSEGSFLRRDEIEKWQGVDATGLYAIYEVSPAVIFEQYYPAGEQVILLVEKEPQSAVALRISDGRIVRVDYLPGALPEFLKETLQNEAGTVILPPLNQ